ncbi:hypothetical protein [Micromonospora sp. NBC_01813]|uniref:hypothetical protein n=1 Tax=Micromonospora sp. NBC_01813 TaxID=2975988 RepID=UPI002DDA9ED1|nr:hypothetical protein [Micromonospora sp. NBC_01813]WSA11288.1 hypothetical protein OG958_11185 [Micromonospora sp. NBC_01813]
MKNRLVRLALAALVVAGSTLVGVAVATPASAVPGLVFVSGVSANNSNSSKEALAVCPAGTRILGGGGFINGGGRQVGFTRLQALGSSDQFAAAAAENGAYAGNWQVHAYGICGSAPAGLEYIGFQTASNSNSFKSAAASCSAGKQLISVGARTTNGAGNVVIDDLRPGTTLTSVSVTGYEDEAGFAGNWTLWAYGVCANPLPGLQLVTTTSAANSADKAIGAACPAGKRLHGLGAETNGGLGEAIHAGVYPDAALTTAVDVSLEDPTGVAGNWYTRAYAICAT